jgi:pimeloyl-ACP methyl ester carboxylesterase
MLHVLLRLRGARRELALTVEQLRRVDQPNLLILGTDDPMCGPTDGPRFAEIVADAVVCTVDGGHAPWIHHSDQIAPIVTGFLDDLPRRAQQGSIR